MDTTLIIILAIILFVLIILNNITIVTTQSITTASQQGVCSQTTFGCCPNGVDSKINYYGTNCPGYRPVPGYPPPLPPQPAPAPNPPKPIGGCSGTRYGCCPNNSTPKINPQGSNCILK
jgi:hypothetical protein